MRNRVFLFLSLPILCLFVLISPLSAQDERLRRAQKLYADATPLLDQQTQEAMRQALLNFKEAQVIFSELGKKTEEAKAFVGIGFVSHAFRGH